MQVKVFGMSVNQEKVHIISTLLGLNCDQNLNEKWRETRKKFSAKQSIAIACNKHFIDIQNLYT